MAHTLKLFVYGSLKKGFMLIAVRIEGGRRIAAWTDVAGFDVNRLESYEGASWRPRGA